ncbi:MAG: adenylate/guanylate cyclase domain-containing protein, partial [Spirochaetes bacterium]|nr:adenylate/guanylate cyclase domain-containing protein [Spirochaetota bacterium]
TVIGDNVNAASRLEGLTRIYKVPIIVSEFIKQDVDANVASHGIAFVELDTVMVKGKTTGRKIFWPILERDFDDKLKKQIAYFEAGLKLYYAGDWKMAQKQFKTCKLPLAEEFIERTKQSCPRNWNGIWEMKTK